MCSCALNWTIIGTDEQIHKMSANTWTVVENEFYPEKTILNVILNGWRGVFHQTQIVNVYLENLIKLKIKSSQDKAIFQNRNQCSKANPLFLLYRF